MFTCTDTDWPVAELEFSATRTPADNDRYMAQIDAWLERGEPFAVVMRHRATRDESTKGESKRAMDWVLSRRGQFERCLRGMALVPQPEEEQRTRRGAAGLRKVMPVPMEVFLDIDEARAGRAARCSPPPSTDAEPPTAPGCGHRPPVPRPSARSCSVRCSRGLGKAPTAPVGTNPIRAYSRTAGPFASPTSRRTDP